MHDELIKITVRIRRSDYDALCEMFPQPVGYNKAIRQILKTQVRILQEEINKEEAAGVKTAEVADAQLKEAINARISSSGHSAKSSDGTSAE